MRTATVTLKPGRAKPLWLGHPWVFADSVASTKSSGDDWVRVVDADGKHIGFGFLSPRSAIRVRLLTREEQPPALGTLLAQRIRRACDLRARLFPDAERTNAYRLVHGEGDALPGLVVDRFGPDVLVAQFGIGATHARREALARALLEASGCASLVARPAGFEDVEGIADDEEEFAVGAPIPDVIEIREGGLRLEAAPRSGQKTGHYVDQRENRLHVGRLAAGLDVLDLYAGTGGFGLQCLAHGARRVEAIDVSERAVAAARRNAGLGGFGGAYEARAADVTETLAALRAEKRRHDLVIADPPNFFPRKGGERGAAKAHRELNVRALSRVAPHGFLATFSCSARLDPVRFLEMLRSASRECRRPFRVLRELAAGPDHPVAHGLPSGRYLSGFLVQVD